MGKVMLGAGLITTLAVVGHAAPVRAERGIAIAVGGGLSIDDEVGHVIPVGWDVELRVSGDATPGLRWRASADTVVGNPDVTSMALAGGIEVESCASRFVCFVAGVELGVRHRRIVDQYPDFNEVFRFREIILGLPLGVRIGSRVAVSVVFGPRVGIMVQAAERNEYEDEYRSIDGRSVLSGRLLAAASVHF